MSSTSLIAVEHVPDFCQFIVDQVETIVSEI